MPGASVTLREVTKGFGDARQNDPVIKSLSLSVEPSEIVSIIGPSGCGKTTVLRMIAGLISPDTGSVEIAESGEGHQKPRIAMVTQEPHLLPWLTVWENTRFAVSRLALEPRLESKRISEALRLVGLSGRESLFPSQLSGGMKQRLAFARALSIDPQLLLLDEPFSALDLISREDIQEEMLQWWGRSRPTVVLVTHSVEEAAFLSHRVAAVGGQPTALLGFHHVNRHRPVDCHETVGSHRLTASYSEDVASLRRLIQTATRRPRE